MARSIAALGWLLVVGLVLAAPAQEPGEKPRKAPAGEEAVAPAAEPLEAPRPARRDEAGPGGEERGRQGVEGLPSWKPRSSGPTGGEEGVRQALEEQATLEFVETPLTDVLQQLEQQHKLKIWIDNSALEEAGVAPDSPITINLHGVKLRTALDLMLRELYLTWLIRDNVMVITTVDEADLQLTTKVYDVRDLLQAGAAQAAGALGADAQALVDTITTAVAPTTWDALGGPGSIVPIYGTLVVSQTREVHEKLAALLAEMRQVLSQRQPGEGIAAAPADPNAMVLRIYWVAPCFAPRGGGFGVGGGLGGGHEATPDGSGPGSEQLHQFGGGLGQPAVAQPVNPAFLEKLSAAIRQFIEPESWEAEAGGASLHVIPARAPGESAALVVRQTPAAHAQIESLLRKLGIEGREAFGGTGVGFF